jgi:hypothetical protein
MRAFVVSVNGQQLCTAGIGANGVLSSNVSWTGREGSGGFHMHVGGLDSSSNQHLQWPVKEIGVGDEIVTRIVETEEIDDPLSRRDRAEIEAKSKTSTANRLASPTIATVLLLSARESGSWKDQGSKHFMVIPRIGEWLAIELNGIEVMAKIAMLAHHDESTASNGVILYAVVEGETNDCLKKLMNM